MSKEKIEGAVINGCYVEFDFDIKLKSTTQHEYYRVYADAKSHCSSCDHQFKLELKWAEDYAYKLSQIGVMVQAVVDVLLEDMKPQLEAHKCVSDKDDNRAEEGEGQAA
jgi:hypothetical protein